MTYLQIDFKTGKFYNYSKEPKEGYEKQGEKGFRKYYDDVIGSISYVSQRTNENLRAEELLIGLKGIDGEEYEVQIQLYIKDTIYTDFVTSFLSYSPNFKKGVVYTIRPYNFTPEGSKWAKIGFSIKDGEEKVARLSREIIKRDGTVLPGEIPAIKWEEKRGKWAANKDDMLDFLYEKLEELKERFKKDISSTPKAQTPKATAPKKEQAIKEEASDDLPF